MKTAPLPPNERERIQSLNEHEILDTLPEEVYDDITRIATEVTGTPIALITLVDKERQWFKSRQNISDVETPREVSFCAHAILTKEEVFIVPDARYDERFFDNPKTTGDPHVVFYAGVPIKDREGNAIGTLCVIDNRPRELTDQQLESLKTLAKLVKAHFELRKTQMDLDKAQDDLRIVQSLVNTMQNEIKDLVRNNPDPDQVRQLAEALKIAVDATRGVGNFSPPQP